MRKTLTLIELNGLVRETIEISLPNAYWVEAELSDVRDNGHCYMELLQKDSLTNTPVARARATCWRNVWMSVRPRFERVTGQRIHAGMKVLLQVRASFHENYGFSWQVLDIDPNYTLGDMERKRQEIIRQLREEGVYDLQRQLHIPLFAQRIAVISSESAAGYGDFADQLARNDRGYRFYTRLFPAIMQGEQVERSVIAALNAIHAAGDCFDVVVIIRGGGSTSDLSGFDTLALAENVANFPLPIITGIGHERDTSVLDMIANTHLKTPTAVAAFLINHLAEVDDRVEKCREALSRGMEKRLRYEHMRLDLLKEKIPVLFSNVRNQQVSRLDALFLRLTGKAQMRMEKENHALDACQQRIQTSVQRKLIYEHHRLEMLEQKALALDPAVLLRRGFSVTMYQGRAVRDAAALRPGDEIETRLEKGIVKSVIK